ncbi:MAG TPA: pitrilysin family protein [Pseudogracilibacillus sp.]|nr:pitrilysin family protein [Pseudogracilibacillus sp.]
MEALREKKTERNGIHFHFIPTNKFKTVNMVIKCKTSLDKNTVTKRALLPYVLEKATQNYPNEKSLMKALDELYGADLAISGAKRGDSHVLTFRLEVANDKFLTHENNLIGEAFQLLHEILYKPYTEDGIFSEKIVEREKSNLKNNLVSVYDDKLAYANMRLIDHMCENERFSIHKNGYVEDLPDITAAALFEYYQQVLAEDDIDIYITGDIDTADLEAQAERIFHLQANPQHQMDKKESVPKHSPNTVVETQDIQQAKLHMGFRTDVTYEHPDYFALQVFNGMFGGFPSSKLFTEVREKESLAYYVASQVENYKGLLFVFSGIAPDSFRQTEKIIMQQKQAMDEGEFTEAETEEAKALLISGVKETLDNAQGIVEMFYERIVHGLKRTPEELIEGIAQVTKEDVKRVSEGVYLDTVYLLTSEEGEK